MFSSRSPLNVRRKGLRRKARSLLSSLGLIFRITPQITPAIAALAAIAVSGPHAALAAPHAASGMPGPSAPGPSAPGRIAPPPVNVYATDGGHPFHRLVEGERAAFTGRREHLPKGDGRFLPRPPGIPGVPPVLDCEHAKHVIELDPATGVTKATLELRVRANGAPLSTVGLYLDEGLTLESASATNRTATLDDAVYPPYRVAHVTLQPALAAGEVTTITVGYEGTLTCGRARGTNAAGVSCTKGGDFSYFPQSSVFPYIFEPDDTYGYSLDALTREIVMRVPATNDVIVTGERVSDEVANGTRTATWTIDKPLARHLQLYAFAGKLGLSQVPGRQVPTTLVFPAPRQDVDDRLSQWSGPVLDFVERSVGRKLPFDRSMSLVRLPSDLGDPGTATFGMTLLSDTYARTGETLHEETWAHENAHLFWGIIVPESDGYESRLMSEGMATLTELDYTHGAHYAGEDRELYLARRFRPIGLDLRLFGRELPPVWLQAGQAVPDDARTSLYTLWAYYKTSATLDNLRVTIGEEAFAAALRLYVDRCSYVGCRPDALRVAAEEASGKSLGWYFDRWVKDSQRPTVKIGFTPTGGSADVTLTKPDEAPMTLELWIRLEDGRLVRRHVELAEKATPLRIDETSAIRSVSLNPRHDLLVDGVSSVRGDLDFDGESDGLDILACARLFGMKYMPTTSVGHWTLDEKFDPRCDLDHDNHIDERDMQILTETFGTLR